MDSNMKESNAGTVLGSFLQENDYNFNPNFISKTW